MFPQIFTESDLRIFVPPLLQSLPQLLSREAGPLLNRLRVLANTDIFAIRTAIHVLRAGPYATSNTPDVLKAPCTGSIGTFLPTLVIGLPSGIVPTSVIRRLRFLVDVDALIRVRNPNNLCLDYWCLCEVSR
jgi:hypothetical protein